MKSINCCRIQKPVWLKDQKQRISPQKTHIKTSIHNCNCNCLFVSLNKFVILFYLQFCPIMLSKTVQVNNEEDFNNKVNKNMTGEYSLILF